MYLHNVSFLVSQETNYFKELTSAHSYSRTPICMYKYLFCLDEVGCIDPDKCFEICESQTGCSNIAMLKLVLEIIPSG